MRRTILLEIVKFIFEYDNPQNVAVTVHSCLLLFFVVVVFWVLEKTLESPLDCKEIQPVHPEGDQPWDPFGRNDAKAEAPVLWPPHAKS